MSAQPEIALDGQGEPLAYDRAYSIVDLARIDTDALHALTAIMSKEEALARHEAGLPPVGGFTNAAAIATLLRCSLRISPDDVEREEVT